MSDTVSNQILDFITNRFPQSPITESEDIFSLGYINSLFAMELVMFIEKTFGFTVPNEELHIDNFRTAESMAGLVKRLRPGVSVG